MFEEEDILSAVAAFVADLASSVNQCHYAEYDVQPKSLPPGSYEPYRLILPGEESPFKRNLEEELSALAARVRYLEDKASTVNNHALPDTPSENGAPTSPFGSNGSNGSNSSNGSNGLNGTLSSGRNGYAIQLRHGSGAARNNHVSNLLAVRTNGRTFSAEDLGHLREHVERQADEIKSQRITILSVGEQLHEEQVKAARTLDKVENEDISRLQRELLKHQQANEAFQKALKEIGSIITNVAQGDLSHKVQIHAIEMDPEITTFKRTINTMMDQLQVFGSEVSRVAREVGTEGNLGGQAHITGVSGIWKELTENGKTHQNLTSSLANDSQSMSWPIT